MKHIAYFLAATLSLMAATGCSDSDNPAGIEDNTIVFNSSTVLVSSQARGRSASRFDFDSQYKGLEASDTTIYIAYQDNINPWGAFQVYMTVAGKPNGGIIPYQVKSGAKGELVSTGSQTALKWVNSTDEHQFHAWSVPETSIIRFDEGGQTGIVDFNNTDQNQMLEYFIGTKTPPLTYRDNGLYVNMMFKHLVSKICIRSIVRIKSDGSKVLVGTGNLLFWDFSFPKMPRYGKFDSGIDGNIFPSVTAINEGAKGVTFNKYDNTCNAYSCYLPPFEFNEYGDFTIRCAEWDNSQTSGGTNYHFLEYYGNLSEIADFDRLKAGEAMVLDLVLNDGKVTGASVYIIGWNDLSNESVSIPARTGIYSLDDLVDAVANGNWDKYCVEENGKKVIRIYNNIDIPYSDITIIIPDGYVLDGLGHNLTGNNLSVRGGDSIDNLYVNGVSQ